MNDDSNLEQLKEIVRWLRFQSIDRAKAAVAEHLNTDQKRMAFELTDGTGATRAIGKKTGVAHATIARWWGEWFSVGIVTGQDGTYKKLFSLSDLGIPIPMVAIKKHGQAAGSKSGETSQKAK